MIEDIISQLLPQIGTMSMIMILIRLLCLVFIIHWVRRRLTGSVAVTLVTLVLSYLLLFHWASFWIPIVLLIIVLPHGPLTLLFDLALGGGGGEEAKKKKSEVRKKQRRRV